MVAIKSNETLVVIYTCSHTSGHLIPTLVITTLLRAI